MVKENSSNLTKIWVTVPVKYLDRFDTMIRGYYPSRSEAIRAGMLSVIKDIQAIEKATK
jgi:metal-responsive CopG/Arc/MetJ family transcriptional regulator